MHALESLNTERGIELVSPSPASNTVAYHVLAELGGRPYLSGAGHADAGHASGVGPICSNVQASMEAYVNPFTKCCARERVQADESLPGGERQRTKRSFHSQVAESQARKRRHGVGRPFKRDRSPNGQSSPKGHCQEEVPEVQGGARA